MTQELKGDLWFEMLQMFIEEQLLHFASQTILNTLSLEVRIILSNYGMLKSIWKVVNLKLHLTSSNLLLDILIQFERSFSIQITTTNAFQLVVKMVFTYGNSLEMSQLNNQFKKKLKLIKRLNHHWKRSKKSWRVTKKVRPKIVRILKKRTFRK